MGINLSIIFKQNYCASKKAVRLINKSVYNAHTDKLVKIYDILTSKSMYELETAEFMFDCIHKTLPKPLIEQFTLNTAYHDHNTRRRHAPHVKCAALVLLLIQYNTKGPAIWGNVHPRVKNIAIKNLFVRTMKSVYIDSLNFSIQYVPFY